MHDKTQLTRAAAQAQTEHLKALVHDAYTVSFQRCSRQTLLRLRCWSITDLSCQLVSRTCRPLVQVLQASDDQHESNPPETWEQHQHQLYET